MLDKHQQLEQTLLAAEKQAIELAKLGADTQPLINSIRDSLTLVRLRLANYAETKPASKPAK